MGEHEARTVFEGERLPFPPVPDTLAKKLVKQREGVFATRPVEHSIYALEVLVEEEAASEQRSTYAIVGFDGYGVASHAVHCIVVTPALALFVQETWGGVAADAHQRRTEIEKSFKLAKRFQESVKTARDRGTIAPDEQLIVSMSNLEPTRWAWRVAGGAPTWDREHDAIVNASKALTQRLR